MYGMYVSTYLTLNETSKGKKAATVECFLRKIQEHEKVNILIRRFETCQVGREHLCHP